MKIGVQIELNQLKTLDSGFRRNDEKQGILTYYEFIKLDVPKVLYIIKSIKVDALVKSHRMAK